MGRCPLVYVSTESVSSWSPQVMFTDFSELTPFAGKYPFRPTTATLPTAFHLSTPDPF
jgi:hypothetical protein